MQKLEALAAWWGPTKAWIETEVGLSPDAVHVHVGMLMFLGFAVMFKKPLSHWLPWVLTLAVELLNETIDLFQAGGMEASMPAGIHDLKNTMFLPTVMVVLVALREWIPMLRPKTKSRRRR